MIDRTTWDDLYPRAKDNDEPQPGIVKGESDGVCWRCKRPTDWLSLYWEAPICSFVCDDLAWVEYGNEAWYVGWQDDVPVNYDRHSR